MNRRACLALFVLVACTSGSHPPARSPSARPSQSASQTAARSFVRTCHTQVGGQLATDVLRHSTNAGPLSLVYLPGYANAPRSEFPWVGEVRSVKLLVLARDRATLSVDPADRGHASLDYDPARFNGRRLSAGEATLTFVACHPHERLGTQFNGGVLIDRLRCVGFEVTWPGRRRHVEASFGAGRCPPS